MGEIVNLRRARKQRDRRAKEEAAQSNRVVHGRSKSERRLTEAERRLDSARLEGHKRERTDDQA